MSLLNDAKDESGKNKYPLCSVAKLDPDLIDEIDEALASPDVSAPGLERALAKRGVRVKSTTLRRHKRGDCTCEPG